MKTACWIPLVVFLANCCSATKYPWQLKLAGMYKQQALFCAKIRLFTGVDHHVFIYCSMNELVSGLKNGVQSIRFNVMDLSRYMTALMKLFQRFYYKQIGKKCLIFLRREISKR